MSVNMNSKYHLLWAGVLAWTMGIWMTGCCTGKGGKAGDGVCKENEQVGMATITCQPMDTNVFQTQPATFRVAATGTDLVYQWYFRGETGCGDVVQGATGDRTPELTVP